MKIFAGNENGLGFGWAIILSLSPPLSLHDFLHQEVQADVQVQIHIYITLHIFIRRKAVIGTRTPVKNGNFVG